MSDAIKNALAFLEVPDWPQTIEALDEDLFHAIGVIKDLVAELEAAIAKREAVPVVKESLTTVPVADVLEKVRQYGSERNSAGVFEANYERGYARELERAASETLAEIEAMLAASQRQGGEP